MLHRPVEFTTQAIILRLLVRLGTNGADAAGSVVAFLSGPSDPRLMENAVEALGEMGESSAERALVEIVENEGLPMSLRQKAAAAVAKIDPDVEALERFISSRESAQRFIDDDGERIANALFPLSSLEDYDPASGEPPDPESALALAQLAGAAEVWRRDGAVELLGALDAEVGDKVLYLRGQYFVALAEKAPNDPITRNTLLQAMSESESTEVRLSALSAFTLTSGDNAPNLVTFMTQPSMPSQGWRQQANSL